MHAPGAEGQIRVAADKVDDHLLADARHVHAAQLVAGPGRAHPQPARAVLVLLAHAVPGELDLDAGQLVGPQVLVLGADDQCNLRASGMRLVPRQFGAQRLGDGVGREVDLDAPLLFAVRCRLCALALLRDVLDEELAVQDEVLDVGGFAGVLLQLEGEAGAMPRNWPLPVARAPWVRRACMRSRARRLPSAKGSLVPVPARGWA